MRPRIGLIGFIAKDLNATYCSEKSTQGFPDALSRILEDDIMKELRAAEHFARMFDQYSDVSVIEQIVM